MDTLCLYIARAPDMYIRPDAQLILRYPIIFFSGFSASPPPHSYLANHQWNLYDTHKHTIAPRVHIYSCGIRERAHEIYDINHTRVVDPCQPAELDGNGNIIYYIYINNKSDKSKEKKKRIFILFFDINKMYYSALFLDFSISVWFREKKKIYIKVFAKRRLTKTRKRLEVFVNFRAWHGVFPFAISVNVFFTSYAFSSQKKKKIILKGKKNNKSSCLSPSI